MTMSTDFLASKDLNLSHALLFLVNWYGLSLHGKKVPDSEALQGFGATKSYVDSSARKSHLKRCPISSIRSDGNTLSHLDSLRVDWTRRNRVVMTSFLVRNGRKQYKNWIEYWIHWTDSRWDLFCHRNSSAFRWQKKTGQNGWRPVGRKSCHLYPILANDDAPFACFTCVVYWLQVSQQQSVAEYEGVSNVYNWLVNKVNTKEW